MAQAVSITPEGTIYDWMRISINYRQYSQAIMFYNMMTPSEKYIVQIKYPYLLDSLNEVYMCQKMASTTLTNNS